MQGTGEQSTKGVKTVQKCVIGLLVVQDYLRTIQNISEICLSGGPRRKHFSIGFTVHQFCHPKCAFWGIDVLILSWLLRKKKLRKHLWPTPLLPREIHMENLRLKGNLNIFTLVCMNEHRWDRQEEVQQSHFPLVSEMPSRTLFWPHDYSFSATCELWTSSWESYTLTPPSLLSRMAFKPQLPTVFWISSLMTPLHVHL